MKNKKLFSGAILSLLSLSLLVGCGKGNTPDEDESKEPKPIEIGDTVREWTSDEDFETSPMLPTGKTATGTGFADVVNDFGNEDDCSIYLDLTPGSSESYIGTDTLKTPYFTEDDAKNGDVISLYFYVPANSNLASLQLQLFGINMGDPIKGEKISITQDNEERWIRTVKTFDTLETLGAIRLYYTAVNKASSVQFYIDDINITYGEETVQTGYTNPEESLYQAYEPYFKFGGCVSAQTLRNTTIRKLVKDNFNSITAENEGKPERILDQKACQKLLQAGDSAGVAITTEPFEKIYSWCEANHIKVRHHTFVWYSQTPDWFFKANYNSGANASKEVMLQRMENFIRVTLETINERWPELVYAIDVSNEAIENNAVRNNNNNWYTTVGKDFVYYSFLYASRYKADYQKLFYNDFSYDYNYNHCQFAVNTLLKEAIQEGLVDGVGIQGHIDAGQNGDVLLNDAKLIKSKGLECQITELDITIDNSNTTTLNNQKKAYKTLMTKILKAQEKGEINMTGVIVWGTTDDTSWKRSQNPLLFTSNYAKKPAYYGCLEAVEEYEATLAEEVEE